MKAVLRLLTGMTIFIVMVISFQKFQLIEPGEHTQSGKISYLAQQRFFCSDWDAMILMHDTDNEYSIDSKVMAFTITDDELRKKVKAAIKSEKEVKIHYVNKMNFCSDSEKLLTSIDVIESPEKMSNGGQLINDSSQDINAKLNTTNQKIKDLEAQVSKQQQEINTLKNTS